MNESTLKLFTENYENKGLCVNLPKFIKTFTKKFKATNTEKTIKYYPWAVVERIFRMQNGSIEVINWAEKIEFKNNDYVLNDSGELVLQEQVNHALFIHLKAKWQDEELEEFYPLFDNQNAKVIKTPDALDLNTARQRGSVRLIARISGIGLDIFEQQDTQFEDGDTPENAGEVIIIKEKENEASKKVVEEQKQPSNKKPKKEIDKENAKAALEQAAKEVEKTQQPEKPQVEKTHPQPEKTQEVVEKQEGTQTTGGFLDGFLKGQVIEPQKQETQKEEKPTTKDEYDKDSEEYANILLEVRKVIRDGNLQTQAKTFVKNKSKQLLSDLSYTELKELIDSLV